MNSNATRESHGSTWSSPRTSQGQGASRPSGSGAGKSSQSKGEGAEDERQRYGDDAPLTDDELDSIGDLGNDQDDPESWMVANEDYWQEVQSAHTRQGYLLHRLTQCIEHLRALSPGRAPPWPKERVAQEEWLAMSMAAFEGSSSAGASSAGSSNEGSSNSKRESISDDWPKRKTQGEASRLSGQSSQPEGATVRQCQACGGGRQGGDCDRDRELLLQREHTTDPTAPKSRKSKRESVVLLDYELLATLLAARAASALEQLRSGRQPSAQEGL